MADEKLRERLSQGVLLPGDAPAILREFDASEAKITELTAQVRQLSAAVGQLTAFAKENSNG